MTNHPLPTRTLLWVSLFSIAFAFVEASVVIYLRALYYPEGFAFPLKPTTDFHLVIELAREGATIGMLAAVGTLAGGKGWERFGYFLLSFGVWDLCYYGWLKVLLDWPRSLTDWDVLFLLPLPWIGPVIAPATVALLMILFGLLIVVRLSRGLFFWPNLMSWIVATMGTLLILYSFLLDIPASLKGEMPAPYEYGFLAVGLLLYLVSFYLSCRLPILASKENG